MTVLTRGVLDDITEQIRLKLKTADEKLQFIEGYNIVIKSEGISWNAAVARSILREICDLEGESEK